MWQVKSLTFCLAHLFPVKPQVCNAGANCSNPNLILCKIAFVSLVTVDIVNSISRTVVNIIVLCKGPSGLVTKLNKKKKKKKDVFFLTQSQKFALSNFRRCQKNNGVVISLTLSSRKFDLHVWRQKITSCQTK